MNWPFTTAEICGSSMSANVMPAGFVWIDITTFWNRRMVDLTGYDMETINRQGWYQSVYPDPDLQARAVERMAQMREGVHLEAENGEITRADGDTRTLRISTSVLDQGDGTPHDQCRSGHAPGRYHPYSRDQCLPHCKQPLCP
jgi:PAS domain S-box-containing protein